MILIACRISSVRSQEIANAARDSARPSHARQLAPDLPIPWEHLGARPRWLLLPPPLGHQRFPGPITRDLLPGLLACRLLHRSLERLACSYALSFSLQGYESTFRNTTYAERAQEAHTPHSGLLVSDPLRRLNWETRRRAR